MGRAQETAFITEGDLYQLIFSPHLPAAKAFTSWDVNEVLPSILRHGISPDLVQLAPSLEFHDTASSAGIVLAAATFLFPCQPGAAAD